MKVGGAHRVILHSQSLADTLQNEQHHWPLCTQCHCLHHPHIITTKNAQGHFQTFLLEVVLPELRAISLEDLITIWYWMVRVRYYRNGILGPCLLVGTAIFRSNRSELLRLSLSFVTYLLVGRTNTNNIGTLGQCRVNSFHHFYITFYRMQFSLDDRH